MDHDLSLATEWVTSVAFGRESTLPPGDGDDWIGSVHRAAAIHGLGPLLGQRVASGEIHMDAPLRPWFLEQAKWNIERLTLLKQDATALIGACTDAGIDVVPLKGIALLLAAERDVSWRPMSDIDLLVPNTSSGDIDAVLAAEGYARSESMWKHRTYRRPTVETTSAFVVGEHPDHPRSVEVHSMLREMFRGFWWNLTPWVLHNTVERAGVHLPNHDALALHLTVHCSTALMEGGGRAIHLIDLARMLEIAGIDGVIRAARAAGVRHSSRFLYPALAFTARETDSEVCRSGRDVLASHVPRGMRQWAESASLFDVSYAGQRDRVLLDRMALWAMSPTERVRMMVATVAPTPAMLPPGSTGTDGGAEPLRRYQRHYTHLFERVFRQARARLREH